MSLIFPFYQADKVKSWNKNSILLFKLVVSLVHKALDTLRSPFFIFKVPIEVENNVMYTFYSTSWISLPPNWSTDPFQGHLLSRVLQQILTLQTCQLLSWSAVSLSTLKLVCFPACQLCSLSALQLVSFRACELYSLRILELASLFVLRPVTSWVGSAARRPNKHGLAELLGERQQRGREWTDTQEADCSLSASL